MPEFKQLCICLMLLASSAANAGKEIWQEVHSPQARGAQPSARAYQVDNLALRASLQRVTEVIGPGSQRIISLPMPDGRLAEFEIYESPIMEDELARDYPEIRTFKVYGIDDPLASGRLDITPAGFHAMLYTSQGRLFIDPDATAPEPDRYQARSHRASNTPAFACGVDELDVPAYSAAKLSSRAEARSSSKLLKYRIAVAATDDYVNNIFNAGASGGRRAQAQAAIVTAINRVNEIYERDLGIFLKLVNGNDQLIELNGEAGFNNSNTPQVLDQNQVWIDDQLGNSMYDVGHVFSTGGGGLAWLGGTCDHPNKARGVSGIANPVGDPFFIDFVAHEIGHQFNAEHSFNGSTMSCGTARNASTAYEVGSGSTIMAYAGICGVEDLQLNSDATFHAGSIMQINEFVAGPGACYTKINASPANPNHPKIDALQNRSIPANTPFVLDGAASDKDMDVLSYQWDQMDTGCKTDAASFGQDLGNNPLFRSYVPQAASARHFPALGTQLQGLYDDAEVLPCHERDLNFRFTVRDDLSGLDTADMKVSVIKTGGRFRITSLDTPVGAPVSDLNTPGQTIVNPATLSVEWNVAGTDKPPVSCANVDIELMTFSAGYTRYTIHPLVMNTPNDGSEALAGITPATDSHLRARIRVKCRNNIFYDISDADFAITGTGAGSFNDTAMVTFFNDNGTTGLTAPACRKVAKCTPEPTTDPDLSGGGKGSSALDYPWLLVLAGLLLLARLSRRFTTPAPPQPVKYKD